MAQSANISGLLQALLQKLGAGNANYDYQDQAARRAYENNLYKLGLNRDKSIVSSSVRMADQGLSRSGIALQGLNDLNQQTNSQQADYGQGLASDLSSTARRRLTSEADYNFQKAELERQAMMAINPSNYPTDTRVNVPNPAQSVRPPAQSVRPPAQSVRPPVLPLPKAPGIPPPVKALGNSSSASVGFKS